MHNKECYTICVSIVYESDTGSKSCWLAKECQNPESNNSESCIEVL